MEQNNLISFANVKAGLFDPEVLTLLAPSVYDPTPERLKCRAEKYSALTKIILQPFTCTVKKVLQKYCLTVAMSKANILNC